jgi:hypothetical protein
MRSRQADRGLQISSGIALSSLCERAPRLSLTSVLLLALTCLCLSTLGCKQPQVDRAPSPEDEATSAPGAAYENIVDSPSEISSVQRLHNRVVRRFVFFHETGEGAKWRTFQTAAEYVDERRDEITQLAVKDGWTSGDIGGFVPLVMSFPTLALPDPDPLGGVNWARYLSFRVSPDLPCLGVVATPGVATQMRSQRNPALRVETLQEWEGKVFVTDGMASVYLPANLGWVREVEIDSAGYVGVMRTPLEWLNGAGKTGARDSVLWTTSAKDGSTVKLETLLDESLERASKSSCPGEEPAFLRSHMVYIKVDVVGEESDREELI